MSIGENNLRKRRSKTNCNNKMDFLKAAITDLSGNLKLLDTKVSIIIASIGVVLGLVVSCKSNYLKAYFYYSVNCMLKTIFLLLSAAFIIRVILTFAFGINCIMIRIGKGKSLSLWFFSTERFGGITEQNYYQKVQHMTDETILKNLANEVYKLNTINNLKMRAAKKTIVLFSLSCLIILVLMVMVGFSYLMV